MRQIKFRGKRLDNGQWAEGNYSELNGVHFITPNKNAQLPSSQYEVNPATVGQFTDLLDKNEKEIYEGDVIGFRKDKVTAALVYEVKWLADGFWLSDRGHGGSLSSQLKDLELFAKGDGWKTIIIGNIHDNPELLKTE